MIAAILMAAAVHAKPASEVHVQYGTGSVAIVGVPLNGVCTPLGAFCTTPEIEVCGRDENRPDLTVCIAGAQHRIRLFMPYPPCGTPEAKTAPMCAEWKIGRPW